MPSQVKNASTNAFSIIKGLCYIQETYTVDSIGNGSTDQWQYDHRDRKTKTKQPEPKRRVG